MKIKLSFALHHQVKIIQMSWNQRCVPLLAQCAM